MRLLLVQSRGPDLELAAALSRWGYEVLLATDGQQAATHYFSSPLSVIVTDYRVGKRSGVWLLQEAARLHRNALRILVGDDPRLDLARIATRGVCHAYLQPPLTGPKIAELLLGVPDVVITDNTPIAGVAAG